MFLDEKGARNTHGKHSRSSDRRYILGLNGETSKPAYPRCTLTGRLGKTDALAQHTHVIRCKFLSSERRHGLSTGVEAAYKYVRS